MVVVFLQKQNYSACFLPQVSFKHWTHTLLSYLARFYMSTLCRAFKTKRLWWVTWQDLASRTPRFTLWEEQRWPLSWWEALPAWRDLFWRMTSDTHPLGPSWHHALASVRAPGLTQWGKGRQVHPPAIGTPASRAGEGDAASPSGCSAWPQQVKAAW